MKKRILFAVAVLATAGSGLIWAAYHPSRSKTGTVQREELTADDLARIDQHHITKLNVSLPEDVYTINLWREEWKKGEAEPTIKMLSTMGSAKSTGQLLLFSFPAEKNPEWFFALGGVTTWGRLDKPTPPEGGFRFAEDGPINPDEDIRLGTVICKNQQGGSSIVGTATDIIPSNELTYIYKVRFCRGDTGNQPTWTHGRVEFSQWIHPETEAK